jgi:hypothetical protein
MQEYGRALAAARPNAISLFDEAADAWQRICSEAPTGSEAAVGMEMHTILAFSYAIEAGNRAEAERLYNSMNAEQRGTTDAAEARHPGSMKIWLRP